MHKMRRLFSEKKKKKKKNINLSSAEFAYGMISVRQWKDIFDQLYSFISHKIF